MKYKHSLVATLLISLGLSGCGGSSGDGSNNTVISSTKNNKNYIRGYVIDEPVANANVELKLSNGEILGYTISTENFGKLS